MAPPTAATSNGQPTSSPLSGRAAVVSSRNRAAFVMSVIRCTSTHAAPPPANPSNVASAVSTAADGRTFDLPSKPEHRYTI